MSSFDRYKVLTVILYHLWDSAEFESDFEANWTSLYKKLKKGKFEKISNETLQMLELWVNDYFKEKRI